MNKKQRSYIEKELSKIIGGMEKVEDWLDKAEESGDTSKVTRYRLRLDKDCEKLKGIDMVLDALGFIRDYVSTVENDKYHPTIKLYTVKEWCERY